MRVRCKIKNCETFSNVKSKYCYSCAKFPCENLKHLDKRYQLKYKMSMIENLKNFGIRKFVAGEKARWACSACGGTICVHKGHCQSCDKRKIGKSY